MQDTVPASKLRALVTCGVDLGADPEALLFVVGGQPSALEGDARLPASAYHEMWDALAEQVPDRDIGLVHAERLDLDGWHVVGHLASRCSTVAEACRVLTRYSPIFHHRGANLAIEVRGGVGVFDPRCDDAVGLGGRHMVESALASFVVQVRRLADPGFVPLEVSLRHERPARIDHHERLFRGPVRFGASTNAVRFDPALLAQPLRTAQSEVARYLSQVAEQQLSTIDDQVSQPVEHVVARSVVRGLSEEGDVPAIERSARTLGLSVRTLQRRLGAAGTNYRRIVDEVRKELSLRWLAEERPTADELARRLAFRDTNSFYRAFRRWTGTTPGDYRSFLA